MGLFDLFDKEKRRESARSKNMQRAVNKYAQSPDRMRALESLADDGSDEALYGLLRRFGMNYDKTIEDEQEKEWVFETLVSKSESAIPAVKRYLISAESISWPLRVLDKVAPKEQELAIVQEVLGRHEPGYERDPTKKMQLLAHLGALKETRATELVVPYLKDMDEGVRFTAVEALLTLGHESLARKPLLELFGSDSEESLRIRLKMAEGFAANGWTVEGFRPAVEKKLPDMYTLDREGHISKKANA